jgi:DNA polymerase-3 subunit alpha
MSQPAFTDRDFVHLHLHSDYSLLQSTIQHKPLAKFLTKSGFKACAVTDYGNMFGAVSFYKTMKDSGLHPIVGYEAYVASGSRFEKSANTAPGERPHYNLVFLAKNNEGFQNLVYLASKAYTEGFYNKPRIDLELLEERSNGLIALSGGRNGSLYHYLRSEDHDRAKRCRCTAERDLWAGRQFLH